MALTKGQRLGPYEIESVAGAGGMGEVYRALDTRLERTVAIKVLPQGVAMSGDARARFEREARTISSLNHPNICTLHDVGQEGVIDYLVMEFLEGETLEERLHRSKMDLAEALTVGIQVAGALEAAHHKGLVHRDLKPGNIFLTKDGAKLMDFGLAKSHNNVVTGMDDNTRTMGVTGAGAIVGTLQYMSPEQLEGKEADHRSDVFAFGAMLYEMVTHCRAFTGESKASLIGSIIKDQPRSISEIMPTSPPALERLIKKCLQKDPDKRWQSAADLKDELEWIASAGSQAGVPTPVAVRRRLQFRLAWVVAAVALCAVAVMSVLLLSDESPVETTARFMLPQLEGTTGIEWPRLSPDGSKIAFLAADTSGVNRIWVRPLNSVDAYVLAGTENAWRPFWSPDSKHLAFFANKRLKRVAASGGPVQTLCEATGEDGSWGKAGVIVFDGNADINPGGLMAADASGGTPRVVTVRDSTQNEAFHSYPWFLPDGKHFLYQILVRWSSRSATWAVRVGSIESSDSRLLMTANSRVEYCEPGYLLYVKGGTLLAHPFDSDDLRFTGEPIALASDVARQWEMGADFAASNNGVLTFRVARGGDQRGDRLLVRVDRRGDTIDTISGLAYYSDVSYSPDGSKVAYSSMSKGADSYDIIVYDLVRGTETNVTRDEVDDLTPVWSPDGSAIAYTTVTWPDMRIFRRSATGAGEASSITLPPECTSPTILAVQWTTDNRLLVSCVSQHTGGVSGASSGFSSILCPVDFPDSSFVLEQLAPEMTYGLSPNNRYLLQVDYSGGKGQVFLVDLDGNMSRRQVSGVYSRRPRWRADGREIFYVQDNQLMAVQVLYGERLGLSGPQRLFPIDCPPGWPDVRGYFSHFGYDVSKDGQEFVVLMPADGENGVKSAEYKVVINWHAELKK